MGKGNQPKTEFHFSLYYGAVHEAQDSNGLADPFVTVQAIKRDGSKSKILYKSTVMKNTLAPKWNEYQTIKVKDYVEDLYIELLDHDIVGKNDLIGRQLISMQKVRNSVFDQMVDFEDDKNKVKGYAKIKIDRKP